MRFNITKQQYLLDSFFLDVYNFNNTNIRNLNKYIEPCYELDIKFDNNNIFYYNDSEDLYQYMYCILKTDPENSIYLTGINETGEENDEAAME